MPDATTQAHPDTPVAEMTSAQYGQPQGDQTPNDAAKAGAPAGNITGHLAPHIPVKVLRRAAVDKFKLDGFLQMNYFHVADDGTKPADLLADDYWANVVNSAHSKLQALDVIRVVDARLSWYCEVMIIATGRNWARAVVLHEVNLGNAAVAAGEMPKEAAEFDVAFHPTQKWRVIRKSDQRLMRDGMQTRDEAQAWLRDYLIATRK